MREIYVVDENATELPLKQIIIIGMCAFLDFFCMNQIMPNVPFMVADYFPDLSTTELGYYSGYLTSCYNLGGIFGNLLWGWFSDNYGRKPTIVISLIGTAVFCQLFGLAPNYLAALIFRFLWRFMNSTVGVVKTYIGEVCNPITMAKGFSLISAAGGLARIVGPLVGGFLSKPEENFPALVKVMPWLRKVRYWIPCFVGSLLCIFTAIFTWITAPETLSREMAKEAKAEKKKNMVRVKEIEAKRKKGENITREEEMLVELSHDSYLHLIVNREVFLTCLLYALVCLGQSAQDSLLPLFLINPIEKGGYDFDQTDIGWLYTGIGPIQIIYNPLIFPLLTRLASYTSIYMSAGIVYSVLLLLYPLVSLASTCSVSVRWFVVLIATVVCILSRLLNFTAVMVLINNSTYSDFRGKVNGLGQVLAAVGRFIGPSMGSSLFAWSITGNHPFPFNFGFTYYILGIMMFVTSFCVKLLPQSINKSKGRIKDVYKPEEIELKMVQKKDGVDTNEGTPICKEEQPQESTVITVPKEDQPPNLTTTELQKEQPQDSTITVEKDQISTSKEADANIGKPSS